MTEEKTSFYPEEAALNATVATELQNTRTESTKDDDSFVEVVMVDCNRAAPGATLELELSPRHEEIGVDSGLLTTQMCATITASDLPEGDDSSRAPVDIVVALDVSGSMHGDKLDLCKKTLQLLLRELRSKDRFGLITFSDEARIEIPARQLTEANKNAASDKIKRLYATGGTNLSGGIGMAAQEIRAVESPNEVRTIFLLSDGHANRGIDDAAGIVGLAQGCLSFGASPVTIHTFGYGDDHDASTLSDISQASSGGTYYFVETDSNIASAFGDALGGILSVVAQNTMLTINAPVGVRVVNVHHDNKIEGEDGSFRVAVGDFYAEESRDVIFEVSLAAPSELARTNGDVRVPHASVSLAYTDTVNKQLVGGKAITTVVGRPSNNNVSVSNPHVVTQWLRVRAAQDMQEAETLSRQGNLSEARARIQFALDEIRREATDGAHSDPVVVQMVSDLNALLAGLSNKRDYDTFGSKHLGWAKQSHKMQRSPVSSAATPHVYRGKRKIAMSHKMSLPK